MHACNRITARFNTKQLSVWVLQFSETAGIKLYIYIYIYAVNNVTVIHIVLLSYKQKLELQVMVK